MVTLDGRGLRIHNTTKELLEQEEAKLKLLKFDEEQRGMVLLGEAQAEFNKAVVMKARGLVASRRTALAFVRYSYWSEHGCGTTALQKRRPPSQ